MSVLPVNLNDQIIFCEAHAPVWTAAPTTIGLTAGQCTTLTSLTGFGFPFHKLLPSHVVGALSLIALALAIVGLYVFRFAGSWRWIYAVSIVVAFWFNSFVAVVQAFQKIPFLHAFAPTQSEPPFAIAQIVVLLIIVWLIYASVKRFHPGTAAAAH